MRLTKIKLAGFKSFVDPTTMPLSSNLIAVVGPNGCGKSNIIDAIRWVMGESSAKHLRGESMSDVIFNGSSARKPVGQASVELVFDNSDGSAGGEYASFNEISVKRQVTREGQSTYLLNNTRCRRKDITDIFLGTGLGPRSYSIIEQGMISRVIEAKPEELRVYLEEAAGISKYKERRRETENRIKHTRENLERLEDIREELGKQLERLNRQAKAAEKYKDYRDQERLLKAQSLALRWSTLNAQNENQQSLIREQEIQLESYVADQRRYDKEIEVKRDTHVEATDKFNEIQAKYYSIGADIARLEEAIQHQKDKRQQLKNDLQQVESDLSAAKQLFSQDQAEIEQCKEIVITLTPEMEAHSARMESTQELMASIEEERAEWQLAWDEFNLSAAESSKLAHVEQTRIQHLEARLQTIVNRVNKLTEEKAQQNTLEVEDQISQLQADQAHLIEQRETTQESLEHTKEQLQLERDNIQQSSDRLDEARNQLQSLRGRKASLEALQQAALGQQGGAAMTWLEGQQLSDRPRLAQSMSVEPAWQTAVETVLGDYLQAVCVSGLNDFLSAIDSLEGSLSFLDTQSALAGQSTGNKAQTLLSQVKTEWLAAESMLSGIYTADTLEQAYALSKTLDAHESVITPEGIWLGNGWLRVSRDEDSSVGVLAREAELKAIDAELETWQETVSSLESTLEQQRAVLEDYEAKRDEQQLALNDISSQQSDANAALQVKQNRLQQLISRADEITAEMAEQESQGAACQSEIEEARTSWQTAMSAMDQNADTRQNLVEQRDEISHRLEHCRDQGRESREALHDIQLKLQSAKTQESSLEQNMQRMSQRIQDLSLRQDSLAETLNKASTPNEDFSEQLQIKLGEHNEVETLLNAARAQVEGLEHDMRQFEEQRSKADQNARAVQSRLEQLRMDGQTFTVRRSTIEEQIAETQYELKTLLDEMPEAANEQHWEEELERIGNRIARLGPINLAAIEEFKTESERKTYLDSQHEDLIEALSTLENAIAKIDKETRTRFRDTYDTVNNTFKELFPRLFGGGRAYLELTGEDLLDTGVTVIAQPPGKRNSSIHLLSGGEKAMTAVALVFSIFRLNPSPFCLLDEVDAPLDDANTTRFSQMVAEMSTNTQFVFITHNKITMEQATHLVGVTMHEPGVSRLVTVDVEEAVSLAEA